MSANPLRTASRSKPWRKWLALGRRSVAEASEDQIGMIAAGVAFYGFLAMVPLLGAIVLVYGLVAEPHQVLHDVRALTNLLPAAAARPIGQQLIESVNASDGKKGVGLVIALGIALFGARNGVGAVIAALNIAYEQEEKRSWVKLNLLTIAITAGLVAAMAIAATLLALADAAASASGMDHVPAVLRVAGKTFAYLLMSAAGAAAAASLYRFGPCRSDARWIWLSPGAVLSAFAWLLLTLGFGAYVSHIAHYDTSAGSLGAVAALLTWMYLNAYALLFGAEINSELEKVGHSTRTQANASPPELANDRPTEPLPAPPPRLQAPPEPQRPRAISKFDVAACATALLVVTIAYARALTK